jgi:hypothetical protein
MHLTLYQPDGPLINLSPTDFKLFFVLPVRSFPRDGPLNRWVCLTTRLQYMFINYETKVM